MINKSIRIIAAGLAASLALVSCAKQEAMDNGSTSPAGGARTIAVSFANASVKSALEEDGLTPKFVANDVIKVSNGTDAPVDCTVSIDGSGNASITTNLTGSLTMVYPATAAKMNSNAIEGVLVPTVQDGTFASANICKATIEDDATSAMFENQTVLFKVTPPDGVKQFTITSLKPVVDGVARTGTAVAINTEGADDAAKLVVSVGGASSDLTTFYVSLAAGVNLTDLKFEYQTTGVAGMDGAIKGITEKSLTASSVSNATAANTLYTIDANNWHPYVEIAGKKWATMNVGATTVAGSYKTCYGDYFAWGETTGHKLNDGMTAPADEHDFSWSTTPFNNGSSDYNSDYFTTNKSEWLTDNVLKPAYDAATANWGSSWRMPTKGEFQALYSACAGEFEGVGPAPLPEPIEAGGVYWSADYNGVAGILFVDKSDISKRVFFPAAGHVIGTSFGSTSGGIYWSSSLYTLFPGGAYYLLFNVSSVVPFHSGSGRYVGNTVRPFSE